jgi:pyruvate/2-oxoglutarate dehydrogenase complex dihydrolipoamide dehydrogenase (E3) component
MSGRHVFDLCVLGGGSAGYAGATSARGMGKTVAIVDGNGPLAGLCILNGCMPSKTLIRSAEIAHLMRVAPTLGVTPSGVRIDVPAIVRRKRRIIAGFADDRIAGLEQFPLFRGAPHFVGPAELQVGDNTISADRFLIATGSHINVPPIAGLTESGFLTSDDILELEKLPKSMVVLGAGDVAVELAQYLARVGVHTTMVQRGPTLLSSEDPDVGEAVRVALERDGIAIHTSALVQRVERRAGRKRVIAQTANGELSVEADEIFAALGRRPSVEGFGFEVAGVSYDCNGIKVDDFLRTSNPRIFAAGDVTGMNELVHVAVCAGALAAKNAFSAAPRRLDTDLWSARAVFTDPQVGIAGLSERQCRDRGIDYHVASYPFYELGKAITAELTDGFVKMLAADGGRILGVTIVGAEASDLIHEAIALIYFGARCHDVMEMPHLHPTLAEIITYPAEELCEKIEHEQHAVVTP